MCYNFLCNNKYLSHSIFLHSHSFWHCLVANKLVKGLLCCPFCILCVPSTGCKSTSRECSLLCKHYPALLLTHVLSFSNYSWYFSNCHFIFFLRGITLLPETPFVSLPSMLRCCCYLPSNQLTSETSGIPRVTYSCLTVLQLILDTIVGVGYLVYRTFSKRLPVSIYTKLTPHALHYFKF